MSRSRAVPVLISNGNDRRQLQRIRLGGGVHDEDWLQDLIHAHPAILPMSDIEPGLGDHIAAAREIRCGHGFIDNLYMTPSGNIVIVETKLWRNSQMRREVVAQTLDYIAALSSMTFEAFELAVSRGKGGSARLYDLVREHPDALEEADFIDAVTLNLQRGRLVAIVLGDGIRTETELLGDLLQSHAGAHFTFALVELAIWQSPNGDMLAVPSTLAKTVTIERGIVRIENGRANLSPLPAPSQVQAQSISSSEFWEKLAQRGPALPAQVQSLLTALEPLGIYPDLKASLNLKADLPDRDKPVNFGYIAKNGQFWTNPASWGVLEPTWRRYFGRVAELVGGTVIDEPGTKYVALGGRGAPRIDQLLPSHQAELVSAMETMLRELNAECVS